MGDGHKISMDDCEPSPTKSQAKKNFKIEHDNILSETDKGVDSKVSKISRIIDNNSSLNANANIKIQDA